MATKHGGKPILVVRVEGPAVAAGRMRLADLAYLGNHLQTAVHRVALVLAGEKSARPGARPKGVKETCSLVVVAMGEGSFTLGLDLDRDQLMLEGVDPGEEAIERLVLGMEPLSFDAPSLPPGYDEGVLLSWREMGNLFDRGISRMEFTLRTRRVQRVTSYDRSVHQRVVARIRGRIQNVRTVEGRLLMADFKEHDRVCRIHPPLGRPVLCTFDEARRDAVLDGLLRFVRVTGEATLDAATGEIARLNIADLEVLDTEPEAEFVAEAPAGDAFWDGLNLESLISEQDVRPIADLEDVMGGWPEDESVDEFLVAVREWRRQDGCWAP